MNSVPQAAHEHVWEPVGIVEEERTFYSPVSALDHTRRLAARNGGSTDEPGLAQPEGAVHMSEQPKFTVRISRGLVTHWFDHPITTWDEASEARDAIFDYTGESGTIEEVLLSVPIQAANSQASPE